MEYSPPFRDVRRAACASGLRQLAADGRSDVHRAHAVKVQVHGLATLQPGPEVSGGLTNRGASARTSRAARLGSRLSGVSSSWRRSTPQACSNSSPCVQDAGRAWVDLLQQNERRTELASSAPRAPPAWRPELTFQETTRTQESSPAVSHVGIGPRQGGAWNRLPCRDGDLLFRRIGQCDVRASRETRRARRRSR